MEAEPAAAAKIAVEMVTALASAVAARAVVAEVDSTCLVEAGIEAAEAAEADRKYFAVARADYSVVVAQGSPLSLLRLSTFITLGEMRNMRKITTTSDK